MVDTCFQQRYISVLVSSKYIPYLCRGCLLQLQSAVLLSQGYHVLQQRRELSSQYSDDKGRICHLCELEYYIPNFSEVMVLAYVKARCWLRPSN